MEPTDAKRAAKIRGLKHLQKQMAILIVHGKGDKTMSHDSVKDATADAAAAPEPGEGTPGEEHEDELDGETDTGAEAGDEAAAAEEQPKEETFDDHIKSFMRRPIHNTRKVEKGSRVVTRSVESEPSAPSAKPGKGAPPSGGKRPFTGRR